jgi:hypothetical protein
VQKAKEIKIPAVEGQRDQAGRREEDARVERRDENRVSLAWFRYSPISSAGGGHGLGVDGFLAGHRLICLEEFPLRE